MGWVFAGCWGERNESEPCLSKTFSVRGDRECHKQPMTLQPWVCVTSEEGTGRDCGWTKGTMMCDVPLLPGLSPWLLHSEDRSPERMRVVNSLPGMNFHQENATPICAHWPLCLPPQWEPTPIQPQPGIPVPCQCDSSWPW